MFGFSAKLLHNALMVRLSPVRFCSCESFSISQHVSTSWPEGTLHRPHHLLYGHVTSHDSRHLTNSIWNLSPGQTHSQTQPPKLTPPPPPAPPPHLGIVFGSRTLLVPFPFGSIELIETRRPTARKRLQARYLQLVILGNQIQCKLLRSNGLHSIQCHREFH